MPVTAPPTTRTPDVADRLIGWGGLAGPLLVALWALQAVTRDGYDVTRHPMSLLARGEGGLVQVVSFVTTGVLVIGLGLGWALLRRPGVGARWLPIMVILCGTGLVGAGVFRADPGAGFPEGAPDGMPTYTVTGVLHEACFVLVMLAWVAALVILFRRARREGDRWLRHAVVACFVLVLALSVFPHLDTFPVRTVVASGVQLGFLALVAARDQRYETRTASASRRVAVIVDGRGPEDLGRSSGRGATGPQ